VQSIGKVYTFIFRILQKDGLDLDKIQNLYDSITQRQENRKKVSKMRFQNLQRKMTIQANKLDIKINPKTLADSTCKFSFYSAKSNKDKTINKTSNLSNNGYLKFKNVLNGSHADYLNVKFPEGNKSIGDLLNLNLENSTTHSPKIKSEIRRPQSMMDSKRIEANSTLRHSVLGTVDKNYVNTTGTPSFKYSIPKRARCKSVIENENISQTQKLNKITVGHGKNLKINKEKMNKQSEFMIQRISTRLRSDKFNLTNKDSYSLNQSQRFPLKSMNFCSNNRLRIRHKPILMKDDSMRSQYSKHNPQKLINARVKVSCRNTSIDNQTDTPISFKNERCKTASVEPKRLSAHNFKKYEIIDLPYSNKMMNLPTKISKNKLDKKRIIIKQSVSKTPTKVNMSRPPQASDRIVRGRYHI